MPYWIWCKCDWRKNQKNQSIFHWPNWLTWTKTKQKDRRWDRSAVWSDEEVYYAAR